VIWGDAAQAGMIAKQMRAAGMKQRVFGSFRIVGDALLENGGSAAEGVEAVYPFDPTRDDPVWVAFGARFEKRFHARPEVFASLAYDTMNILLQAICRAGLNRGLIRDALANVESFKGVTGEMAFDPNSKNIVPLYLATVHGGKYAFRRYPLQAPYAKVGENRVEYNGPAVSDAPAGPARIAVFGPDAEAVAARLNGLAPAGYSVVGVRSDVPWGKASADLVKLIYEEHALAMIATDRNSSHLAEQFAVKAFVPLIAMSSDRALFAVNIPWIFRAPGESNAENAFAVLVKAAGRSGPNRARLRDVLAEQQPAPAP
jgi:branched-chain amino acid transport system substrate-binding protein